MAENDIWKVQQMVTINDRATHFVTYYKETTAQDEDRMGDPIAAAWNDQVRPALDGVLSSDCTLPRVQSWLQGAPGIPGRVVSINKAGVIVSPALPSNKCLLFRFFQGGFEAARNNRIYISGTPENQSTRNTFNDAYLTGVVLNLRNKLLTPLTQLSGGAGIWTPVCSVKQNLPFDVANFPAVTGITAHPIIYSQAPRTRRAFNAEL